MYPKGIQNVSETYLNVFKLHSNTSDMISEYICNMYLKKRLNRFKNTSKCIQNVSKKYSNVSEMYPNCIKLKCMQNTYVIWI